MRGDRDTPTEASKRPKCLDCQGFDAIHTNPPKGVSWCQCGDRRCGCYGWDKAAVSWVGRHVPMGKRDV